MSEPTSPWRCPECGGVQDRDLRRLRRGTGRFLLLGGVAGVLVLAVNPEPVSRVWLVVAAAVIALGLVALGGAARARYCVRCDVRMQPPG